MVPLDRESGPRRRRLRIAFVHGRAAQPAVGGAEKGDLLLIFCALQVRHGTDASADIPRGERGFEHAMQIGTTSSAFTMDTAAMQCFVSQREMEAALALGGVERRHDRDGFWLLAPWEARIEVNAAPQPL